MPSNWLASAITENTPAGVVVPSMSVSLSMRRTVVPVASAIVTLPDAFSAGNVPAVIVTLLTRMRRPSSASPAPSASCASVTNCGATDVVPGSETTLVAVISVRPLNCVIAPIASTLSPIANGPKLADVLNTSMPPVASWM